MAEAEDFRFLLDVAGCVRMGEDALCTHVEEEAQNVSLNPGHTAAVLPVSCVPRRTAGPFISLSIFLMSLPVV